MKLTRLKSERPRRKHDFYPTPYGLAKTALIQLMLDTSSVCGDDDILDAGAGQGVWGKALIELIEKSSSVQQNSLTGIDIQVYPKPDCYHAWYTQDFLSFDPPHKYDLVMGNPPYSFMEEFIHKSLEMLNSGGYVFFMGRLEFLASQTRYKSLWTVTPPRKMYVLSRRPSFFSVKRVNDKPTDAQDYAMYLWQKDWKGKSELDWLYWDYDEELDYVR